jgi:phosphopantothenoylcysteine decarboxylase / phosphopantothenate---cysteine ligase
MSRVTLKTRQYTPWMLEWRDVETIESIRYRSLMVTPEGRPRVLLGVTGSIAAYKAVEIARLFIKAGARVEVAMTDSAQKFIAPLTFQAITARPVIVDLFRLSDRIEHVEQAHAVDLLVVAPATAHSIAKLALGLADDPVSAIALATRAPIVVAPAMETGMWENRATIANVEKLRERGVVLVGPEAGDLASGRSGPGRMSEPETIVERALALLRPPDFKGVGMIVTAGPTWEAIDPVRFLSNRSTGAMGIEIARCAAARGANVTLILGPSQLEPPVSPRVTTVRVESAAEMLEAGEKALDGNTVLIASAAVSDFRPEKAEPKKLKRSNAGARQLALAENPDVLATLAGKLRERERPGAPVIVVGFAAETEEIEKNAKGKLAQKGCDLIIGNAVGKSAGFGRDSTKVLAVPKPDRGPPVEFGPATKEKVAQFVLDQVLWVRKQKMS